MLVGTSSWAMYVCMKLSPKLPRIFKISICREIEEVVRDVGDLLEKGRYILLCVGVGCCELGYQNRISGRTDVRMMAKPILIGRKKYKLPWSYRCQ